jgi:bacillopeptidase F
MKPRSRLYRHIDGERKKQTIFLLLGIILIIVLLLKFAPAIVDGIGSLILRVNEGKEPPQKQESIALVTAPMLKAEYSATDSARIDISGDSSTDTGTVELYLDNELVDKMKLHDRNFTFQDVKLNDGQNSFTARLVTNNNKSDFSDELIILKTDEKTAIEELSPSDGQEFKKGDERIEVKGKTNALNTVTVNGSRAIVDQNGGFSYMLQLHDGDNEIKVEATSPSGKTADQTIHVKFTP